MNFGARIADFCVRKYGLVTAAMLIVTLVIAAAAALPSIWPTAFPFLSGVTVDTDPENMLSHDEPVRVFHDQMKKELTLHEIVVVGVVNEDHPNGVFNAQSLKRVYELTEFAKTLQWEEDGETVGVVTADLIAPSTVDNIEQGGLGTVKFEWLMPEPPDTDEAAEAVRTKAQRLPFLDGTLVSEDGKAVCLYLPLTSKTLSYRVYSELKKKIATFEGDERYYITGLPVAEDTFGVEMFIQMAVSAPAAMLVIFLLMLLFFRRLVLVISPMIIAMVSVIFTMGLLIICGFPVHIMSSMIPIFIMPIAVLDAVHILSEFFERYQATRDRHQTIVTVIDELFMPMLYTSLTSAAGFASLALTPIPPVQVFGVFVAVGILAAWVLTIVFMPAYVMFISPRALESFGAAHDAATGTAAADTWLARLMNWTARVTYVRAKLILALSLVVLLVAGYGISRIVINDNPVKWFEKSHDIRVADRVLNEHFGGTYMAYLALEAAEQAFNAGGDAADFGALAVARADELKAELPNAPTVFAELSTLAAELSTQANTRAAWLGRLAESVMARADAADDELAFAWEEAGLFVDEQRQRAEVFKDPEVLRYMAELQDVMHASAVVGKSNSLADIVKTVHRALLEGEQSQFRIPENRRMVAECLMQFQNGHRPDDLWHFVTPDYRTSSLWVQLTSGDNRDMRKVADTIDAYVAEHPPPAGITHRWFGLTYINIEWQQKMVGGMLQAFAGSFLVVFILMAILFRSALWGLLSMIPLTVTIVAIYGAVGLVGKSYDMPVAVLSSLSLGLAVDFAIHFLARSRRYHEEHGTWERTVPVVFGEPARAIMRNIIVIATGFTPLLLAPLMPYKTVGVLLAIILLVSGVATLLILPAAIRVLESRLFVTKGTDRPGLQLCNLSGDLARRGLADRHYAASGRLQLQPADLGRHRGHTADGPDLWSAFTPIGVPDACARERRVNMSTNLASHHVDHGVAGDRGLR